MNVRDIIWKGIQDAGGTGLCCNGCGCEYPDLVPCQSDPCNCVPAARKPCNSDCMECGCDGCMVPVELTTGEWDLRIGSNICSSINVQGVLSIGDNVIVGDESVALVESKKRAGMYIAGMTDSDGDPLFYLVSRSLLKVISFDRRSLEVSASQVQPDAQKGKS